MTETSRSAQPLADLQAERAVLAAALLDGEGQERIIPRVATILRPGDFYDPRHALLWEVLLALHTRGEPVDVLTVVAELRTRDRERKLLKKIEQSIVRIDAGDYGYCDETGEPIGVGRLLARPTATLSLEAQQRRELKQKMFGD